MPAEQATLSPLERQILNARMKVGQEMPDVADAPVEPMGWLERLGAAAKEKMTGGGRIVATTNLGYRPTDSVGMPVEGSAVGRIAYNPEVLGEQGPNGIEDTLAHELTHVQQARKAQGGGGLFDQVRAKLEALKQGLTEYGQQPDELEAYQVEGDRALRERRAPGATPNFSSPGMRDSGDIELLPEETLEKMRKIQRGQHGR